MMIEVFPLQTTSLIPCVGTRFVHMN